jgi:hypothetical protein
MAFRVANQNTIITTTGDLGIGTLTPNANSTIIANSANAIIRITQLGTGPAIHVTTGRIGVGTNNPSASIETTGNISAPGGFTVGSNTVWHSGNDGSGSGLDADTLDSNNSSYFTDANNMSTGILPTGRIAGAYLGITGVGALTDLTVTGNTAIDTNTLFVDSTGNQVGIGKVRPNATLDVVGTVNATSWINATSIKADALFVGANAVWHSSNDGSGSGLDADLLDGNNSNFFTDANNMSTGTLPTGRVSGAYTGITGVGTLADLTVTGNTAIDTNTLFVDSVGNQVGIGKVRPNVALDVVGSINATSKIITSNIVTDVVTLNGNTNWHSGNDGSGSGLDADLLDGNDSSFYQNSTNQNAGTLPSGRISGSYTGITDVGTLNTLGVTGNTSVDSTTFFVDSVGNKIGVGKTQPNATVDIIGTVNATSWINATSMKADSFIAGSNTVWHAGNDGSGSGLDADLLDGNNSNFFTNATNMTTGILPSGRISGLYFGITQVGTLIDLTVTGNTALGSTLYVDSVGNQIGIGKARPNSTVDVVGTINATSWINATSIRVDSILYTPGTLWHSENDGSGSGLDADLLDGNNSNFFTNANNITTGIMPIARLVGPYTSITALGPLTGLTVTGNTTISNGVSAFWLAGNVSTNLITSGATNMPINMAYNGNVVVNVSNVVTITGKDEFAKIIMYNNSSGLSNIASAIAQIVAYSNNSVGNVKQVGYLLFSGTDFTDSHEYVNMNFGAMQNGTIITPLRINAGSVASQTAQVMAISADFVVQAGTKIQLKPGLPGSSNVDSGSMGVELISVGMSSAAKYFPALKWLSSDLDFVTETPKLCAMIVARGREIFNSDSSSGTALDFYSAGNTAGVANVTTLGMTLTENQNLTVANGISATWVEGKMNASNLAIGTTPLTVLPANLATLSANTTGVGTDPLDVVQHYQLGPLAYLNRYDVRGIGVETLTTNKQLYPHDDGKRYIVTANLTMTLPLAAECEQDWKVLAKVRGANIILTIQRAGTDTIDGGTTSTITSNAGGEIWYSGASSFETFV